MSLRNLIIPLLFTILLFSSCIKTDEYSIEEPGDAVVSMTIEKSFGEDQFQVVRAIFKNEVGEISQLNDGIVKFNGIQLDWNSSTKAYYIDANYIIQEDILNTFEITFPNGDISTNEVKTPLFLEGVEIPLELNINVNTEIKWNGGNTSDEILLVIWTRPFEMEQWEILLSTSTPDDGSYMILSSLFENYMEEWHVAIELARGINETPDPLLRDGSELYSLFVFGQYTGKLISN